jgi:hypothetical protein
MTTESIAIDPAAGEAKQDELTPMGYQAYKASMEAPAKPESAKTEDKADDKPTEEEAAAAAAAEEASKAEAEEAGKRVKTDAERERARMQRGIDRRTREREEARATASAAIARAEAAEAQLNLLTRGTKENNNQTAETDSEPLSLTRAELAKIVKAEAEKLAPTLNQQQAEFERRQGVIQSFEAKLGADRFAEVAQDLDDAFGGLKDGEGKPKPAMDAVFDADDPVKVAEWLADPVNHAEASRISKLSATQAGKAIARLEFTFEAEAKAAADAKAAEKAKAKPIPSKAPAPLELVRGQGSVSTVPSPFNYQAWAAHQNALERKGR